MRVRRRPAIAAMALAVAMGAPLAIGAGLSVGAGLATAASTSATTLSKSTGLDPDGETITVTGSGFAGGGSGVYVGLVQDSKFSATDADAWMTTAWIKPTDITDGSWSATVDVAAVIGNSDCLKNTCSIYTVAAHGSPDRSQDTKAPVVFAAPTTQPPTTQPPTTQPPTTTPRPTTSPPATTTTTQPPTTSPPPTTQPPVTQPPTTSKPPAGNGPSVSLDRSSGLNAGGDTITVRGSGFSGGGAGIYVGLAQKNLYSSTDASVFQDAKFVKSSDMSSGAWSVTLSVNSAVPGGDCLANSCAVYTLAAHGSSDRSQDTVTDVSFVGAPPAGGGGTGGGGGGAAGGAAAGGAFASNSALTVTLSKSTDLSPGGETVTISGSGFSGAAPGLYVGMVQDDKFSSTDASVWMTTAFLKPDAISGGSWSTTMELAAVTGGSDCMKNTCSIYTVAAHGSSDRTQDSRTPVGFLGGVAPSADTSMAAGGGAPAARPAGLVGEGNTVKVELSKSEDLDAAGESITIKGSGFSGEGAGIYVGLIQDDRFTFTDASAWMATGFVQASEMTDGAWDIDLEVKALVGDSDCLANACSIYTVAAHGSSDRTQDSQTPVTFTGDPGAAVATTGDDGVAGSSAQFRNLANSFSQASTWLVLLIGGLLGAGLAVGSVAVLRRRA